MIRSKAIIATILALALVIVSFSLLPEMTAISHQKGGSNAVSYPSATNTTKPVWAFKGAYLNYTFSYYSHFNNVTQKNTSYVNYSIISVFTTNRTVEFTTNYGAGYPLAALNNIKQFSNYTGTVIHFPALTAASLGKVNSGSIPYGNTSQSPYVVVNYESVNSTTVKVGYGSYSAKEMTVHEKLLIINQTVFANTWIDPHTGIVLKTQLQIRSSSGISGDNESLASTNIIKKSSQDTLYLIAALVAAVVVITVLALYANGRKSSAKPRHSEEVTPNVPQTPKFNAVGEARKQELQSLLDKGLISKEYFDESVERLK